MKRSETVEKAEGSSLGNRVTALKRRALGLLEEVSQLF